MRTIPRLPATGGITVDDINWELAPGPWPTPPSTSVEDPIARIVDLTNERDTYRELAQQILHGLAHLQRCHDRLTARYQQLLEECQRLRARLRKVA